MDELEKLVNTEQLEHRNDVVEYPHGLFSVSPVATDHETLCAALDGILLVHNKPITYERLSKVLGISMELTEQLVLERKKEYDEEPKCGIQIAILENGVQLATKAKVSHFIQRLDGQKMVSLSLPALETLSVIAFKQPITKAEVDAIRGVNSDGVVNTLLEKKLIYVSGEKQVLGKPRLYSTTQDFLYYFGMKSLKELPVPTVDITEALTPEGQRSEVLDQQKEVEKDFNTSQGFMPIEDTDNESGRVSNGNESASESGYEMEKKVFSEAKGNIATSDELIEDASSQNIGE